MIRIGIVGCGRILAAHLRGYQLLREAGVDDFRITALCARKEDDARMYVRRGEGPPQRPAVSDRAGDPLAIGDLYLSDFQSDVDVAVYTDYRHMIAEGPIDAVNDFTTHALHHQIAAEAFAHGKDLLTQKPLAITIAAARRMCDEAEARDRVLGVFENARNRPGTRHLRWLFESGLGGALQMALLGNAGTWWAPNRIVAETPWRHRRADAGGITLDLGVHQANVLRCVAGEVTDVDGRTAVLEPIRYTLDKQGAVVEQMECDADDTFFAHLATDRGATANLFASWGGHGASTVVGQGAVFYGGQCRATGDEVVFDDGRAHSLAELYAAQCDPARRQRHFPLGLDDGFALNQYDWLEAIRQRREPETSGREGLRDLAVAYAILESAQAGRRVTVDEVADGALRDYQRPLDERFNLS
ncbi:MAG: Gfo/Idh/MocA family oxidoreductase [Pirellulaceae bacterium]